MIIYYNPLIQVNQNDIIDILPTNHIQNILMVIDNMFYLPTNPIQKTSESNRKTRGL